jgi:hypothetical protein
VLESPDHLDDQNDVIELTTFTYTSVHKASHTTVLSVDSVLPLVPEETDVTVTSVIVQGSGPI